jgi:RNA polymerase sigma-70 factor (ECF subfamily)
MEHPSDIELIHKVNNGDRDALEMLFEKHYLSVYRLSYRWCGVRENAEDITQDVFVKLVQKLNTFNQKASFRTWLYRITINTAKDYHRKNAKKYTVESSFDDDNVQDNPQTQEDRIAAKQLYKKIHQLPEKQREAILLVFAEGLSHKDAARILNCMETTISWRIFQARKTLKASMGNESE